MSKSCQASHGLFDNKKKKCIDKKRFGYLPALFNAEGEESITIRLSMRSG